MAPKALPALVLLAQTYIGGGATGGLPAGMRPLPYPYARGGGSAAAGMQPPSYTNTRGGGSVAAGDDGTGGLSAVEDKKASRHANARFLFRPPPTSSPGSAPSWLTQD